MKVLDITEFWSERGGGVRSYLTSKAAMLVRLGVEHRVLAPGPRDEQSTLAVGAGASSRLLRLAGPPMPYDPTYHLFVRLQAARRLVLDEAPDVLEIHSPELAALVALSVPRRTLRARTLVWHSDVIDTHVSWRIARRTSERVARLVTRPLWRSVASLARRCDRTFVASRYQAEKLRTHAVPGVYELTFGVDTDVFNPQAYDTTCWSEISGSPRAPVLVAVGRLAVEKQWELLIDAFRELRARRELRLALVGDGPERAPLERRASGIPDVYFLGFERDRRRLARLLASADALVHAGAFETFGLAVAEAVASGTPVVVPDAGGAAEQAPPGCSERYAAGDVRGLVAAIERLLARNPVELRQSARAAAPNVVSIEEHFRRVTRVYEELAQRRTVAPVLESSAVGA